MDNKFTPRRFLFYRFVTKKVLIFFFIIILKGKRENARNVGKKFLFVKINPINKKN